MNFVGRGLFSEMFIGNLMNRPVVVVLKITMSLPFEIHTDLHRRKKNKTSVQSQFSYISCP